MDIAKWHFPRVFLKKRYTTNDWDAAKKQIYKVQYQQEQ